MKVDNFSKITPLLDFGKDTYYVVKIIGGTERLIFIDGPGKLEEHRQEITELCHIYNSEATIELNPRSLEKWSIVLAKKLLDRIELKDFNSAFNLPEKVGMSEETINTRGLLIDRRRWLLKVEDKTYIGKIESWITRNNIRKVSNIPTLNGEHIIIESFNYKLLGLKLGETVKTENTSFILSPTCNTLLYY